jgi:hypothetical protein
MTMDLGRWPVAEIETEKRRWAILAHLAATPGYELSDELLTLGVRAQAVPATQDQLRAALRWLSDHELVRCREALGMVIATLTADGFEVAQGYRIVPGVLRPGPPAR